MVGGLACVALLEACGGHESHTVRVRSALDRGRPEEAVSALDDVLGVKPGELPNSLKGDKALFVLDRATIYQELGKYDASKRDYQAVDKAIELLDLSRNATDSLGEYLFSDDAGNYRAPPTERLLLNAMNIINYLETKDSQGALVEARRFAVMQKFTGDGAETKPESEAFGSLMAGTAYETAGQLDEALRFYKDALRVSKPTSIQAAVRRMGAEGGGEPSANEAAGEEGELVIVVGYGRVPPKIAKRIPIGLALTLVSGSLSPHNYARANALAAQGLVTWINYPTLGEEQGSFQPPVVTIDGAAAPAFDTFAVSSDIRTEWQNVEGRVIGSAITRLIARTAVGVGIQAAAGRENAGIGLLASLVAQATLSGLDTPDTRSWETLPSRLAYTRVRLPAGPHHLFLSAGGRERKGEVTVVANRVAFVSLIALR